jgi:hypothetical protein
MDTARYHRKTIIKVKTITIDLKTITTNHIITTTNHIITTINHQDSHHRDITTTNTAITRTTKTSHIIID